MKRKRHRKPPKYRKAPKYRKQPKYLSKLSDAHISRIAEVVSTAFHMAEQGLRPEPLEIDDMFEGQFTGEIRETSWHFADHLLLLSISSEQLKTSIRFDILVDEHELATALADIPIIAHLALQVTPVEKLPSDDIRYDEIPEGVPLWRVHSLDFQEYPDDTYCMLFLTTEEGAPDAEQHDSDT